MYIVYIDLDTRYKRYSPIAAQYIVNRYATVFPASP